MSEQTEHEKQIVLDLLPGIVTEEQEQIIRAALRGDCEKYEVTSEYTLWLVSHEYGDDESE